MFLRSFVKHRHHEDVFLCRR